LREHSIEPSGGIETSRHFNKGDEHLKVEQAPEPPQPSSKDDLNAAVEMNEEANN
jgi:hypothetical protein